MVEEFLACDTKPLTGREVEVETKDSPLSNVIVSMPKVTTIIGKQETGRPSKLELLRWQIS